MSYGNELKHAMSTLEKLIQPCEIEQQQHGDKGQHGLWCKTHSKVSLIYSYPTVAHLKCVSGEYIGTTLYFEEELPRIARLQTVKA